MRMSSDLFLNWSHGMMKIDLNSHTHSRNGENDESGPLMCELVSNNCGLACEPVHSVSTNDLTFKEKLSLVSGDSLWTTPPLPRLGVPQLSLSDGPHGVRKPVRELALNESHPATCFPTACALACSWDENLLRCIGVALQQECTHYGVNILLGPGLNLKRHPLGGRNFEYFSEDPLISGRLAFAYVQGVQDKKKVAACVKHLAVNNQESHRFVVDAVVDERTLRELYFCGFEHVINTPVNQQPATVMCAYNKLNGTYCSEHRELLTTVLREEWGFQGVTLTDWGAANNRSVGIAAGMDLEMPGSHGAHHWEIKERLRHGELHEGCINESVQRVLNLIQRYGTDQKPVAVYDKSHPMWNDHYKLAYKAAMDCCVLLKNDNNFLPLKIGTLQKVALIGDFARGHPRYQGMGSSAVKSVKVVTVYDEIKRFIPNESNVLFAPGYLVDDEHVENVDTLLVDDAVRIAKDADVVIVCVGLPDIMESEGFDRSHMRMPAQHNALVDDVCKVNNNVVVVLSNGGVVEIPWCNKPKAILESYLLGEAGGAAVVDLIFGVQSPCGKLAETFAERVEDVLADQFFPGTRDCVEHREGLLVGYRYFDTKHKQVRFPFGHGLSYTSFVYSDLKLSIHVDKSDVRLAEVTLKVLNSGAFAGKEIVQCYISAVASSVFRPEQELKDFSKIELEAGESKNVFFKLSSRAFSFYDIGAKKWVDEKGVFEVRVGSSSRDIRLKDSLTFEHGSTASLVARESYPPIQINIGEKIDDSIFAKRFGSREEDVLNTLMSTRDETGIKHFHRNSLLKEVAQRRWLGKLLLYVVFKGASGDIERGPSRVRAKRMIMETVKNLPLRSLVLFSKGGLSFDTLDAIIDLLNLHFSAALMKFCTAFYHFIRPKQ